MSKVIDKRRVEIYFESIGEQDATVRWQVFESGEWSAKLIASGEVSLAKQSTGYWRTVDTRLRK